jgi:hypothetical protein
MCGYERNRTFSAFGIEEVLGSRSISNPPQGPGSSDRWAAPSRGPVFPGAYRRMRTMHDRVPGHTRFTSGGRNVTTSAVDPRVAAPALTSNCAPKLTGSAVHTALAPGKDEIKFA